MSDCDLLYLLIFDRRLQCRPACGSNRRKRAEKLNRASPIGCHKPIGLKRTGCGSSSMGRAARQRSRRLKPRNNR